MVKSHLPKFENWSNHKISLYFECLIEDLLSLNNLIKDHLQLPHTTKWQKSQKYDQRKEKTSELGRWVVMNWQDWRNKKIDFSFAILEKNPIRIFFFPSSSSCLFVVVFGFNDIGFEERELNNKLSLSLRIWVKFDGMLTPKPQTQIKISSHKTKTWWNNYDLIFFDSFIFLQHKLLWKCRRWNEFEILFLLGLILSLISSWL